MFVMPGALENRAQEIARGWAGSLTMGAGQFCTNPGITILPNGPGADQYVSAAVEALKKVGGQTMLTDGIAKAYREGADRFTSRSRHRSGAAVAANPRAQAGRVLVNGFPTGVEVVDSMVHGGPYPASTNFGATSVGTMSIRRFLRPVAYQNLPEALLPEDLCDMTS